MSSHGGLLSVCSKNFVKFCVVLSNICIWAWLYVSSGSLQRCSSYVFHVFMLHFWGFLSKKTPPKKWSNYSLLRVRKDWKILENTQKWIAMWNIGKLKISSLPTFFGAWQMEHFLTNLFRKLYPRLIIHTFRKTKDCRQHAFVMNNTWAWKEVRLLVTV